MHDQIYTRDVEMRGVILVHHRSRDVGHVSSCVAFTGNVYFEVGDAEELLPIGEEVYEILCCFFLSSCRDLANGVASANRLIDPARG